MYSGMCSILSGLYSLDAMSTAPPGATTKMTPDTAECTLNTIQINTDVYYQSYLALGSGGDQNHPVENHRSTVANLTVFRTNINRESHGGTDTLCDFLKTAILSPFKKPTMDSVSVKQYFQPLSWGN